MVVIWLSELPLLDQEMIYSLSLGVHYELLKEEKESSPKQEEEVLIAKSQPL